MSAVREALSNALDARIVRSRHILQDMVATEHRFKEFAQMQIENNEEIEELLDCLENEADYLERAASG